MQEKIFLQLQNIYANQIRSVLLSENCFLDKTFAIKKICIQKSASQFENEDR